MAREMKNSGVKWVGEIPKNWRISRIKYISNNEANSFCDGDWIESPNITDSGIRYLTSGNIGEGKFKRQGSGYITDVTFRTLGCKYAYPGDLVFSRLNAPFGRSCILPDDEDKYVIAVDNVILRTDEDKRYVCYFTQTLQYQQYIELLCNGMAMQRIARKKLGDISIPLPPLSEQQAIADFLDAKCAEIDGLLADLDAEVKTLAEYKKSIIAETVTRGLNPNVSMKQSEIPWVGEIPSHWKVIANKYIMHKKKEIVPVYEGQDIISLSMNGVIVRDLDAGGKMPTTFNGYQHIYPGNLLMCLFDIDVTPRCIGLIKNDGLTSPAYSQFVMDGDAYAPYYYYFYLKMDNDKELVHLSKNMRHSLNEEQFGMIKTVFPPREEQEAIATYLDEKCAAIEQSIADKQTQIETLKAYKASLIYEYVTGKRQVN